MTSPDRKQEEAEFHDRLRAVHEADPEAYAYYTSNKKWYAVSRSSQAFVDRWIQEHGPGKRLLDFGCGSGRNAIFAAQYCAQVLGVDISPESVRLATERAAAFSLEQRASFAVMDGENLTLPSNSYDLVVVDGVLHHMELHGALRQIHRVLAPDGEGIVLEALANNPLIHAYRRRTPHLRTAWEVKHILRAESADAMRAYFDEVQVRYFHLLALGAVPFRKSPIFGSLLSILEALDLVLLSVPGIRRQAWMACFVLSSRRALPATDI